MWIQLSFCKGVFGVSFLLLGFLVLLWVGFGFVSGVLFAVFLLQYLLFSLLYNHSIFTFPLFYILTGNTLFLEVSNAMSLNHHKGLTLNYVFQCLFKINQKTKQTHTANTNTLLFCSLTSVVLCFGKESSGFCCPCRDAEFTRAVVTTTGQLFYCDILKLLCMLRDQMLPVPE